MFKQRWLFISCGLGFILLLLTHIVFLSTVPGFHYDEAWAANFALRIAQEKNFWPVQAMSPYTWAWAHYVAAFFFKIFGPSVFIYRISQIFFCFLGILLLCISLFQLGSPRAAAVFPWLVASMPALVLNQRFAIEMTGFHVFCAGLFCFALLKKNNFWLLLIASILGITSHILFLALPLSVLITMILLEKEISIKARKTIVWTCILLLPFFISITVGLQNTIGKPAKGLALICFTIFLLVFFLKPRRLLHLVGLQKFVVLFCLPFLINFLFFSEGHWSIKQQLGFITFPWLCGASLLLLSALVYYGFDWKKFQFFIIWFLILICLLSIMMLKPAPRYFELALLFFSILIAFFLEVQKKQIFYFLSVSFIILCQVQLWGNYFLPAQNIGTKEQSFHFFIYKDSSRDFLSKQKLAQYIIEQGCSLSLVVSMDSRVLEAMRFLEKTYQPLEQKHCPWLALRVERKSNIDWIHANAIVAEVADFIIARE